MRLEGLIVSGFKNFISLQSMQFAVLSVLSLLIAGGGSMEAPMLRLSVRDCCSFRFKRQSLAISIAGAVALFLATPITGNAAECSVATYGQAAYARVKEKVRERFFKVEQFQFPVYEEVEISISSGCLIKVQGEFSFKQARNLKRKKFDADLIPKATAPHGVKIEKLRVSN